MTLEIPVETVMEAPVEVVQMTLRSLKPGAEQLQVFQVLRALKLQELQ